MGTVGEDLPCGGREGHPLDVNQHRQRDTVAKIVHGGDPGTHFLGVDRGPWLIPHLRDTTGQLEGTLARNVNPVQAAPSPSRPQFPSRRQNSFATAAGTDHFLKDRNVPVSPLLWACLALSEGWLGPGNPGPGRTPDRGGLLVDEGANPRQAIEKFFSTAELKTLPRICRRCRHRGPHHHVAIRWLSSTV
jgi:hypothetical protein